jgi:hypothetical protein
MAQPENFAILQPLVAGTIWLTVRGLKGSTGSYVAAGLLVGLASLARNDGFILGLAVGLVFVWDRGRAWLSHGRIAPRLPWRAAFGCFGLYLLVMGPWFLRQELTFGSISPTTSGGAALWIRTIQEWNSITADPSLSKFLAQGPGPIVGSRVGGLLSAIGNFAVIVCSVVLVPFLLIGAWLRRRSIDFGPWFLYAFLVFLGATLLYPLHVPGGAFIHSAVGSRPTPTSCRSRASRPWSCGSRSAVRLGSEDRDPAVHHRGRRVRRPDGTAVRVRPQEAWIESRAPRSRSRARWTASASHRTTAC